MNNFSRLKCKTHGSVRAAYVCQHLSAPVQQAKGVGFVAVRDEGDCINAWCDTCEAYRVANGDEWNDKTESFASIGLLCESCAMERARVNGVSVVT